MIESMKNSKHKNNEPKLAPLNNVRILLQLTEQLLNRDEGVPGLATFHGFTGYGKTIAAAYVANKYKAVYVEMGFSWTAKALCEKILVELEIIPKRHTVAAMTDLIIESLNIEQRVLFIDEADYLLKREGLCDLIKEVHDKTDCPVILVGEELLPKKLQEYERFHNRFLNFLPAEAVNRQDIDILAKLYAPEITITSQLLDALHNASTGQVRRVVVNLSRLKERAKEMGVSTIGLDAKGKLPIHFWTASAPNRREMGE